MKKILRDKVKKITKAVVAITMAVTCTLGLAGNVYADVHYKDTWSVGAYSYGNIVTSDNVSLYLSDKKYAWTVTYALTGSYSYVQLSGVNCPVNMSSGNNKMSAKATKYFTVGDTSVSTAYPYVIIKVSLNYEDMGTNYKGTLGLTGSN